MICCALYLTLSSGSAIGALALPSLAYCVIRNESRGYTYAFPPSMYLFPPVSSVPLIPTRSSPV